ncbi:transcriptional regulator, AraC family [Catenulispora acidiphila DSM 44928]|uniref:DNA-3-methyladenine glycosylase II n=1 Tax=Catenulispora acidiphila (strain DSM 44928 / JCM 14897 / NBRC 102108 / NRRL B-24433 / ID139908) TaxID=479433 RepID=C7QDZ2_CATAD|nr:DNA-3-methyladenine glycosylase 2 [Catenulispora acidiphila]ACU76580.1 transcriptional regulator, AraC family [Catenulispora acidiphila DSM 44928]
MPETALLDDFDTYYRAVASRDTRFDGRFFTGVTTTGVYCRPICPARTPKPENVRFFRVAAAAEAAGFRTCRRCRPDKVPGSPDWNIRADLAGRALRLIADGAADQQDGVAALARTLAVSERHLHRVLVAELGVGPLTLARSRRAQTARLLLESTALPVSDVAFAAGYGSIRQFNDSVREAFGATPSEIRVRFGSGAAAAELAGSAVEGDGALTLRLTYRTPFDFAALLGWFGDRAIPGVDEVVGTGRDLVYRRALRLPHGTGQVELRDDKGVVHARLVVDDLRDVAVAVRRCRDLLDLDADPAQVDAVLAGDPALAPLVAARPGLRVPGAVDGFEIAVRAVLGQQISVAAARTMTARLVQRFSAVELAAEAALVPNAALPAVSPAVSGSPTATSALAAASGATRDPDKDSDPEAAPASHFVDKKADLLPFPRPETLAAGDYEGLGLTRRTVATLRALATAVASGDLALDRGVDRTEARAKLLAVPGIGPWTADYVALRVFGDPDAFPVGDLIVRRQAERLGLPGAEKALLAHAESWRPWRAYAALHLWASSGDPVIEATEGTEQ